MKSFRQIPQNNSGFMTAEFLFAFTMVIGCGIVIFALTFSLTTIEISQYIVWSAARAHAAGNLTGALPDNDSQKAGKLKYTNLTAAFPLLTGNGSDSPWFRMPTTDESPDFKIGDLADSIGKGEIDKENRSGAEARHPWVGVQSSIDLILFKGLQIPFLGKITETPDEFKFPVRGILLRNPSVKECQTFFENKYKDGIKRLPAESNQWRTGFSSQRDMDYAPIEDNGC